MEVISHLNLKIIERIPFTPYSFAKVAICHLLQMLYKTEKFPAVIIRLFLVYGPNQNKDRFYRI